MCDMQKMPREDASCEDDSEMNFATFQTVGGSGTHFVTTTGGQIPVTKLQQNVANNGSGLQQVVGMMNSAGVVDGVQYLRTLDGGATLQPSPQLISLPISLPGAKPGDPQPTVQIQVLNPNVLAQQQPKYQMQIPIQGFQQGGAVLTLAYSPDSVDTGSLQLLGNSLPEGIQVLAAIPHEMQLMQQPQQEKEQQMVQHQVYITPNHQIVINGPEDVKPAINNNTSSDNNNELSTIVIKEERDDDMNDDESSQGTEASDSWSVCSGSTNHAAIINYLNTLTPQQAQALPASLQQFLRLNPADIKKDVPQMEIEISPMVEDKKEVMAEAVVGADGTVRIQTKKKKKYKKKPPKPARTKPGQVVIATASDGTPIFCCPECQMAYPEKEQLEMHLSASHKIERRFICGICGAGLKRKEHLERHKLGHNPERPYVCVVCRKGFKRREHLNLHAVIHSGLKNEVCGECGKGFYRKDHLRKHMRSHETKRARSEAAGGGAGAGDADVTPAIAAAAQPGQPVSEITIHVPTRANMQPIQINIPPHVVSSLAAQQQQHSDAHTQLDALLAQHT